MLLYAGARAPVQHGTGRPAGGQPSGSGPRGASCTCCSHRNLRFLRSSAGCRGKILQPLRHGISDELSGESRLCYGIQNAIQKVDGFGSGVTACNLQRFINHNGRGSAGETDHFRNCHAQNIAVHAGHAIQPPVGGVLLDEAVHFCFTRNSNPEDVFSKPAHVRICILLFAGLPEGLPDLVGRLLAHVELEEHLHGEFTGLAAFSGSTHFATASASILRWSETISIAAAAASKPLLPIFRPARSSACSSVSQVRTPKVCGTPVSCWDWPMPRVTSL